MHIEFVLPGLHRVHRGAEVAFESIAHEIAEMGLDEVTLVGSGREIPGRSYKFEHVGGITRERFEHLPKIPPFRSEYIYEEASWLVNYLRRKGRSDVDLTVTCSYPFVNWALTRWPPFQAKPAHVFVTQNGDWPAFSDKAEYRFFHCDGLVCINPDFYQRNKDRWPSVLIPNGMDPAKFSPGPPARGDFGLPESGPLVLMVSALVESKRVLQGMRAVASLAGAYLLVAGDGPLRDEFDRLGNELMPGRFRRTTLPLDQMPNLYRSADVMLHPTYYESFGNVYAEALAAGTPVVAHDYSVTRWIFGRGYPGLVDASDESAVTIALDQAIATKSSDMLSRAKDAAERFSWKGIAREYRAFFAETHGRRSANSGRVKHAR